MKFIFASKLVSNVYEKICKRKFILKINMSLGMFTKKYDMDDKISK